MSYDVSTWAGNVRNAEAKFLGVVAHSLEQFSNGNYSDLAKLLSITHGKKSKAIKVIEGDRLQFATPLRNILKKALSDVNMRFDPEKPLGVVFKVGANGGVNHDVIEGLQEFSKRNYTIRHKVFKEAFKPERKEAKEKTLGEKQKQVKTYLEKFAKDNGMTFEQAKALVSGLK